MSYQRHESAVGRRFAQMLDVVVRHFGVRKEQELINHIGAIRLQELYAGSLPHLGEFELICALLEVPASTFLVHAKGEHSELEIAFADVLDALRESSPEERCAVADKLTGLATEIRLQKSRSTLPDSLLALVRGV